MKKELLALFISYLFCTLFLNAQAVDPKTAQTVALHFFNGRSTQPATEMHQVPTGEAKYYLFEPLNGNGFVMVSSERSLSPILAYSMTQKFNLDGAPENLKAWLGNYTEQIQFATENPQRPSRKLNEQWTSLLAGTQAELRTAKVGPLLTTRWGQDATYNNLCPKNSMKQQALTGCTATAMAQIMKYWNYPLIGQGGTAATFDNDASDGISGLFESKIGGTLYKWQEMNDTIDARSWPATAQLMRDAGIAVQTNYGIGASGAFGRNVTTAMHTYFGYNSSPLLARDQYTKEDWEDMLRNAIDNGIPVFYSGVRLDAAGNPVAAHAWVCDGYENNHFHMNWGWEDEARDTWLALDFLIPRPGKHYSNTHEAIFGFTPQHCMPDYFSTGIEMNSVQVSGWIQANSEILPEQGKNVVFSAGDGITLLPDFFVPEGSSFSAWIAGCGGRNSLNSVAGGETETTSNALPTTETVANPQTSLNELSIAPNPFSGSTTVTYALENEQLVSAQLLDVTGRLMASPISQQRQVAGEHRFTLDANNLPAGLYFLALQTGVKRQTQRVVITK